MATSDAQDRVAIGSGMPRLRGDHAASWNQLRRQGFSLVELLVVIAVIAVLAGLLFPAAGLVRSKARMIACMGNLRQVRLAVSAYAADNHGLLPYALDRSGYHWYELLASYADVSDKANVNFNDASFAHRNILVGCSEYKRDPARPWRVGYGYNRKPALSGSTATLMYSAADAASRKFRDFMMGGIGQPSSRPMFGCSDEWTLGVSEAGPWWSYGGHWDPHQGRSSWMFYDLHLETMTSGQAVYRLYDPILYQ